MIPKKYKWLEEEKSPRILREMLKLHGTKEYGGEDDNPKILAWANEIRPYVGIDYKHDSTPWCGLVMGVVAHRAKFTPPKICVRAKEWLKFGWGIEPELGCVLVFSRRGGGHVGLYVGEDDNYYHVLGGNQKDSVSFTRISKDRLSGSRECPWKYRKPDGIRKVKLDSQGIISYNEN